MVSQLHVVEHYTVAYKNHVFCPLTESFYVSTVLHGLGKWNQTEEM